MSSGAIKLPHSCPICGITANTHQELVKIFGLRNMDKNEKKGPNKVRSQARCSKCRNL